MCGCRTGCERIYSLGCRTYDWVEHAHMVEGAIGFLYETESPSKVWTGVRCPYACCAGCTLKTSLSWRSLAAPWRKRSVLQISMLLSAHVGRSWPKLYLIFTVITTEGTGGGDPTYLAEYQKVCFQRSLVIVNILGFKSSLHAWHCAVHVNSATSDI